MTMLHGPSKLAVVIFVVIGQTNMVLVIFPNLESRIIVLQLLFTNTRCIQNILDMCRIADAMDKNNSPISLAQELVRILN